MMLNLIDAVGGFENPVAQLVPSWGLPASPPSAVLGGLFALFAGAMASSRHCRREGTDLGAELDVGVPPEVHGALSDRFALGDGVSVENGPDEAA